MLYFLTWIPILAALGVLFVPKENDKVLKTIGFIGTGIPFLLTLYVFMSFDVARGGFQFVQSVDWLPALGISYKVGVDGINLTLCLLHALVSFAGTFMANRTQTRLKDYTFYYLVLIGALYGIFTSLDLFFMYLFYELTLIPLYPMIGIWGSKNKEYGAMKLTIFITAGAVLALVGLIMLYVQLGIQSFDLIEITNVLNRTPLETSFQTVVAPIILVGFGIMASIWPLHSWSPVGYAVAPTSVSMLHAGVLKKMGPYLILRVAVGMLPEGTMHWAPVLATLAGIGIIYAGYAAIKQTDLKYMVGFSSVSHMGYVLLAIAAMNEVSLSAAVLLMFSHGVMAACVFATIGFIYEQAHTRGIRDFGGLGKKVPFLATVFVMASMASLGLPGFANFVAELLVFISAWQQYPIIVAFAVFGILITALYLLRAVQHVCFGPENPRWKNLSDALSWNERFPYILLLGALLLFGCWPQGLLRIIQPAVGALLP